LLTYYTFLSGFSSHSDQLIYDQRSSIVEQIDNSCFGSNINFFLIFQDILKHLTLNYGHTSIKRCDFKAIYNINKKSLKEY